MSDAATADYMKTLDVELEEASANDAGRRAGCLRRASFVLPELRMGAAIAGVFFVGLLGLGIVSFRLMQPRPLKESSLWPATAKPCSTAMGASSRKLNVQEGQFVKEGDLLLQISASELVAQERGLAGETYALLAQRARLIAERSERTRLRGACRVRLDP